MNKSYDSKSINTQKINWTSSKLNVSASKDAINKVRDNPQNRKKKMYKSCI